MRKITLDLDKCKDMLTRQNGVKKLQEDLLNQVLNAEMDEHIGAERYERSAQRRAYRNGYRCRPLKTRGGTLNLQVPQSRDKPFSTELFVRYQRSEQALILAMMEMVLQGVSTRKVKKITEALCGAQFAKSTVSRLCAQLDKRVQAFKARSLSATAYPFVLADAMVIKVRQDHAVRPMSLLIAVGINAEGRREVLGSAVAAQESQSSWSALFSQLLSRGLHGVELVVSDGHRGLMQAIAESFPSAQWQRCQVHLARNVLDRCPRKWQAPLRHAMRDLFNSRSQAAARTVFTEIAEDFGTKAPKAVDLLEERLDEATAVLTLPWKYRLRLRSTNMVERLIEELRRRERVIRIFPNAASAERLMGALLVEWHERWMAGQRYFAMEEYHEVLQARRAAPVDLRSPSAARRAPAVPPHQQKPIYSTIGT